MWQYQHAFLAARSGAGFSVDMLLGGCRWYNPRLLCLDSTPKVDITKEGLVIGWF